MKIGGIKGEFAPSRKVDGVSDQVAQFTTGGGGDSLTDAGLGNNSLHEGADVWTNGSATSINDAPPVFKTGSNWDVICDIGTSIKQTSVADALTNYRLNGDADHNGLTSDITVDPKTGVINGPLINLIIDPNETYDVAIQSLIDDMMTGFMKLDDIRGEFDAGENEKVDVTYRLKDVIITSFDNADTLTNYNPGKGASLKDVIITSFDNADALTNYRPFSEMNQGDPFSELDQGVFAPVNVLRSDNRFVFEPLNTMTSFGDSFDPGLDGANGFKPREVAAVEIGQPPEPKLWLQMLG